MRSLWFMPVTFVAGQHGFALFAPYLAAFLALAHFTRARRRKAAVVAGPTAEIVAALPSLSA
jgi:hypothetical protein